MFVKINEMHYHRTLCLDSALVNPSTATHVVRTVRVRFPVTGGCQRVVAVVVSSG